MATSWTQDRGFVTTLLRFEISAFSAAESSSAGTDSVFFLFLARPLSGDDVSVPVAMAVVVMVEISAIVSEFSGLLSGDNLSIGLAMAISPSSQELMSEKIHPNREETSKKKQKRETLTLDRDQNPKPDQA